MADALDPILYAPNGIGLFAIGVSPIGTRPILDPNTTILSQYSASPTILNLVGYFEQWLDPTEMIDHFFDWVWNVDTAIGWGLDVWGRIVGIPNGRFLELEGQFLGFEEAGPLTAYPFNQGTLYPGGPTTGNFILSDDAYRQVIYAKALANICDGSIPGINQVLQLLFPQRGAAYVADLGNMAMQYVFDFDLTPVDVALVEQANVLPKPTGVSVTYLIT